MMSTKALKFSAYASLAFMAASCSLSLYNYYKVVSQGNKLRELQSEPVYVATQQSLGRRKREKQSVPQ